MRIIPDEPNVQGRWVLFHAKIRRRLCQVRACCCKPVTTRQVRDRHIWPKRTRAELLREQACTQRDRRTKRLTLSTTIGTHDKRRLTRGNKKTYSHASQALLLPGSQIREIYTHRVITVSEQRYSSIYNCIYIIYSVKLPRHPRG